MARKEKTANLIQLTDAKTFELSRPRQRKMVNPTMMQKA
jgi:hypothetical protein